MGLNWVRFGDKWDNYRTFRSHKSVTFSNQISVHFVAKLTHFGLQSDMTASGVQCSDGRFGSKVGQIGPKWDKSGFFSDQNSVYFVSMSQQF